MRQLNRSGMFGVALGWSLALAAQATPDAGADVAARAEVGVAVTAVGADSFARAVVEFPGGVKAYPAIPYETLMGYRPMTLDLFLPPASFKSKGPRPLLIYVHGGGWVGGGPRRSGAYSDWPQVLASMAEHGYVVASISYRFAKEAPFPAPIQDVKAGIRFLRAHAADYNIDPSPARSMIFGQSAGGHLAALAALTCGVAALEPPPPPNPGSDRVETGRQAEAGDSAISDCVHGAATWYGIYDFTSMPARQFASGSPPALLLDCKEGACNPEMVKAASPVTYVSPHSPPILVLHGVKDRTVPADQARIFEAALKAAGVRTDLILYPDSDHSWINPTADETREVSRDALKRTLDFADSLIGEGAGK
jgi:acetyl esterase/lipase